LTQTVRKCQLRNEGCPKIDTRLISKMDSERAYFILNYSALKSQQPFPPTFVDVTKLLADDCETRYKYCKVCSLAVRGGMRCLPSRVTCGQVRS